MADTQQVRVREHDELVTQQQAQPVRRVHGQALAEADAPSTAAEAGQAAPAAHGARDGRSHSAAAARRRRRAAAAVGVGAELQRDHRSHGGELVRLRLRVRLGARLGVRLRLGFGAGAGLGLGLRLRAHLVGVHVLAVGLGGEPADLDAVAEAGRGPLCHLGRRQVGTERPDVEEGLG